MDKYMALVAIKVDLLLILRVALVVLVLCGGILAALTIGLL